MKDLTLKDFIDGMDKLFKEQREADIKRNKESKLEEEKQKKAKLEILKLRHVHAKVDALAGLYPMTKEKLLGQIELIHDGNMLMDDQGMIYGSTKAWCRLMISSEMFELTPAKLYDYYLTEVKPYIF